MTENSWNLDAATRADLRLLMATLREYASYVLLDCEVFKPIGASLDRDGAVGLAVAKPEGGSDPASYETALLHGFKALMTEEKIRAAGYVNAGPNPGPDQAQNPDALLMKMECISGVSVLVTLPFSADDDGEVTFGEGIIQEDAAWLWNTP